MDYSKILSDKYEKFMLLKLYIVGDNKLKDMYKQSIEKHNQNVLNNDFVDAGFDLFNPTMLTVRDNKIYSMDYLINCEASVVTIRDNIKIEYPTGFYMYPRSSIYKTPLRMANCVGIIDAGYRGNVKAHFDCAPTFCSTEINNYDRLVQLCAPSLMPIYVELVETKEELSTTSRGNNGFGSTGK